MQSGGAGTRVVATRALLDPQAVIYFSPRERQVLTLVQERGLSSRQIGHELKLSHHTVRFYLKAVRKKLPEPYRVMSPPAQAILLWTLQSA